jgi:hypothetical protein
MSTRTETRIVKASPEGVLAVIADPDACARWAPVNFRSDHPPGRRLRAGSRTHVRGWIAGRPVTFHVVVSRADERGLTLSATGPVQLEVDYQLTAQPTGTLVRASIEVRSRHRLMGTVIAHAATRLLAAGALPAALRGIAKEAQQNATAEPEPATRATPTATASQAPRPTCAGGLRAGGAVA